MAGAAPGNGAQADSVRPPRTPDGTRRPFRAIGPRARGALVPAATAGILALLLCSLELSEIGARLAAIPVETLLACAAIAACFPLLSALRWRTLLAGLGIELDFRRSAVMVLGIFPINAVSPARAGDLLRIRALRGRAPADLVLAGLLAERMMDVAILAAIAAAGAAWLGRWDLALPATAVLAAAFGLCLLSGRMRERDDFAAEGSRTARIAAKARSVAGVFARLRRRPGTVALAAAIGLCHWLCAILLVRLLFGGVSAPLSVVDVAAAMPLAIFVGLLPVTLGGIGTRDAAMVLLFGAWASPEQSAAVALLYTAFVYAFLALIGMPFIGRALGAGGRTAC
jgi:hypothetical protein